MKQIWQPENKDGWIYFKERKFAWFPTHGQGTLIWLRHYWITWPEKNGMPIMASDVLSKQDMASMNNQDEQMYVVIWPHEPANPKEHARLMPIIRALLEDREALVGALEKIAHESNGLENENMALCQALSDVECAERALTATTERLKQLAGEEQNV